ncbi:hypothetical protein SBA6_590034 [Candidatus Sulfopaludibacter sp. SbA6]|nr:hypothetical protein SBA6_590034 [Candidatus Sulfopaludibacter sp. SbA6]
MDLSWAAAYGFSIAFHPLSETLQPYVLHLHLKDKQILKVVS